MHNGRREIATQAAYIRDTIILEIKMKNYLIFIKNTLIYFE